MRSDTKSGRSSEIQDHQANRVPDAGTREPLPTVRRDDAEFRDFAESIVQHIDEVFFWRDPDSLKPYFVSHAFERIWGRSCQSVYAEPSSWTESIHPEDLDRVIGTGLQVPSGWRQPLGGKYYIITKELVGYNGILYRRIRYHP